MLENFRFWTKNSFWMNRNAEEKATGNIGCIKSINSEQSLHLYSSVVLWRMRLKISKVLTYGRISVSLADIADLISPWPISDKPWVLLIGTLFWSNITCFCVHVWICLPYYEKVTYKSYESLVSLSYFTQLYTILKTERTNKTEVVTCTGFVSVSNAIPSNYFFLSFSMTAYFHWGKLIPFNLS